MMRRGHDFDRQAAIDQAVRPYRDALRLVREELLTLSGGGSNAVDVAAKVDSIIERALVDGGVRR